MPGVPPAAPPSSHGGHDLVGDVEVGVHVLDVVAVLERVDQLEHPSRPVLVERDGDAGDERGVGGLVLHAGALQGVAYGDEVTGLADHLEGLAEVVDLLGAGVEYRAEHVVLGQRAGLGDDDDALAGEQVRDAAGVGEVAAVAGQRGAYLGGGAVAVVGQALDEDGDAVGPVPLVLDRLVVGAAGLLAGAPLDRAVDVVVGDRVLLGLLDGVVEGGVTGRVTAAGPGRDLNVLDQPGEQLAALGIDHGLLVLGRRPL